MAHQILLQQFAFDGQQSTKELGFEWDALFPLALTTVSREKPPLAAFIDVLREVSISGKLLELAKNHGGAILIRRLLMIHHRTIASLLMHLDFRRMRRLDDRL